MDTCPKESQLAELAGITVFTKLAGIAVLTKLAEMGLGAQHRVDVTQYKRV